MFCFKPKSGYDVHMHLFILSLIYVQNLLFISETVSPLRDLVLQQRLALL